MTFYWHLQFAGAFAKTLAKGAARFRLESLEPQWISSPSPVRVRCDVERLRYSRESAAAITIHMMVKPMLRAANPDSANPRLLPR